MLLSIDYYIPLSGWRDPTAAGCMQRDGLGWQVQKEMGTYGEEYLDSAVNDLEVLEINYAACHGDVGVIV